jgi:uncharacterized membrane protein YeaQ/YmgE (transglycosylase-associated protein family)
MIEILIICLIGAIAGYIAGAIVKSDNDSLLLNIVIGIVGGFIGYKLFGHMLHITGNVWVNKTLTAIAGAAILAFIIKIIRRR